APRRTTAFVLAGRPATSKAPTFENRIVQIRGNTYGNQDATVARSWPCFRDVQVFGRLTSEPCLAWPALLDQRAVDGAPQPDTTGGPSDLGPGQSGDQGVSGRTCR